MKRLAVYGLTIALLLPALAYGAGTEKSWSGVISDSTCGAKHTMMPGKSDKECTEACVKMGAKYVLVVGGKTVYQLSDQKAPATFAGERATVTGKLDAKTKTIEVASITAPPAAAKSKKAAK